MGSFDQFEIVAYLAPGAIVLIAYAAIWPITKPPYGDATIAVAFTVASYAVGRIVGAVAAALQAMLFRQRGPRALGGRPSGGWLLDRLAEDQIERFIILLQTRLVRTIPKEGIGALQTREWNTISRQIYVDVGANSGASRVDIFNRLFNFYRGLGMSVVVIACMIFARALQVHNWSLLTYVAIPGALALVCISQMRSFNRLYTSELLQRFLLLPARSPDDSRQ